MKTKNILLALALLATSACSDFLDIDAPRTQIASDGVFSSDATARSAVAGIYAAMMNSGSFASGGVGSMSLQAGFSADELLDLGNTPVSRQFYRNSLEVTNSTVENMWANLYQYIFYANSILEGVADNTTLTPALRNQVEGEARFIRAFSYFYLVNLFGDVPLAETTNFKTTSTLDRTTSSEIYRRLTEDLIAARDLLPQDYSHAAGNRIRPNTFAASALLARTYLFRGLWANAETEASRVIANTALYDLVPDLNTIFLKNSREAIWQLMPTNPQFNTFEASIFRSVSIAAATPTLYNAIAAADRRKTSWFTPRTSGANTYQSPFKYKVGTTGQPVTEFSAVLRLAELFLVRAEARARQGNLTGAAEDINRIRQRAGLPLATFTSTDEALTQIMAERRIELFSEWGHRWLDLKRTASADATLQPVKDEWNTTDSLYPIPKTERDNNGNLTQNPGY